MLKTAAIIFCDCCEEATACFERGWRAYIACDSRLEAYVIVVCPACAERKFGEDEAAWSH
jgi:hypothetical protein